MIEFQWPWMFLALPVPLLVWWLSRPAPETGGSALKVPFYARFVALRQDATGGLQVKTPGAWIDAPPIAGSFICNIGDMLDRMTGGLYRSTPHRVSNVSDRARLSFPFFFDPSFDAHVRPITPAAEFNDDKGERWDGASVHEFEGTYGAYLLGKVAKVFPELGGDVL